MSRIGKLSFAQQKCVRTVGMLMHKSGMAGPGAEVPSPGLADDGMPDH